METVQKKQCVVYNVLVNYYVGKSKGKQGVVLFLHGWRVDGLIWKPLFSFFLERGYDVYAIDFPGFGNSDNPPMPFDLQNYADCVKEFMKKVKIDEAVVIGHSFGGRVAIKLTTQNPSLIAKLILVDSAGIQQQTLEKTIKKVIAKVLKPFFAPSFMKPIRKKVYAIMGAEDYVATPQIQTTYLNIIREDLTPLLPLIKPETLIVWGENDTDTPIEFATTMSASIPRAQLVTIPNAGHFSFLDDTNAFQEAVSSFLSL